jgi:hypothetical protein
MAERHDHGKNFGGKYRIRPCAKSFILQVYDVFPAVDRQLFTAHPIIRLSGLPQLFEMVGGNSVDVRSQEPTKVHANTERIAVELERNAATKIELEIQITDRFVVNTAVEAVVTDEIRRAS